MNVFFVSNSTCYYFTPCLFGMLNEVGLGDCKLALVYYGGCSIQQHCEWLRDDLPNYQFRVIDKDGLHIYPQYSLKQALSTDKWDVISFDNNAKSFASGDMKTALTITEPYFNELFGKVKEMHPNARYIWHEVWANEVGYTISFEMKDKAQRSSIFKAKQEMMYHMMNEYSLDGAPTGDAWEKVRDLPIITTPGPEFSKEEKFTLCSRIKKGGFIDDFTHDGDIGGGQYLNACVWFEILTGKSCIGNAFRPKYTYNEKELSLGEEKIRILQNAAHEAVKEHLNKIKPML